MTLDEVVRDCPYCGEPQTLLVDGSAGNSRYTEDCQICCRPMIVAVAVDHDGDLDGLIVMREDD